MIDAEEAEERARHEHDGHEAAGDPARRAEEQARREAAAEATRRATEEQARRRAAEPEPPAAAETLDPPVTGEAAPESETDAAQQADPESGEFPIYVWLERAVPAESETEDWPRSLVKAREEARRGDTPLA
jgi:hypothetical protein